MDYTWVADQLERLSYVQGLMHLLEIVITKHQSLSIKCAESDSTLPVWSTLQSSFGESRDSILHVAQRALNVATSDSSLDCISDVFEAVSSASYSESLITLVTHTLADHSMGDVSKDNRMDMKKSMLRGILCGAGTECALQVMDTVGSLFWKDLPFEVFGRLVSHEERRKKRQTLTGNLARSLTNIYGLENQKRCLLKYELFGNETALEASARAKEKNHGRLPAECRPYLTSKRTRRRRIQP